ncbi:hypothetical protein HHI36_005156 [Cryptolaemus montrouzieri]|uniref:Uncharacterized protein n=1 Tax=Cryptolaemus montrouzieri TaxID=559131 RepID=A0ABD2NTE7_9CUCU
MSEIQSGYEKKLAELKRKLEESEIKTKVLESELENMKTNDKIFNQTQAILTKANSDFCFRIDTLNTVDSDLKSQLEKVDPLNKDFKDQLKNENTQCNAKIFEETEQKFTEEIEDLKELKKSLLTTIEVLTADKKMLGERLAAREDECMESPKICGKFADVTAMESRLYNKLLESLKKKLAPRYKTR